MNQYERRRKREIGMAFLAEVVSDVLAEDREGAAAQGLTGGDVAWALDLQGEDLGTFFRIVLMEMERTGETEVRDINGVRRWRLRP